jgi:hypothetical protein
MIAFYANSCQDVEYCRGHWRLAFTPFLGPGGVQGFSVSCIFEGRPKGPWIGSDMEEQIAFAVRQHESGTAVEVIISKMRISEPTFYQWEKKFAGLGVAELRRLK